MCRGLPRFHAAIARRQHAVDAPLRGSILDLSHVMPDVLARMWDQIAARPDGPLALRFYLQPLMSISLAVIDGLHDADERRPPFLWTVLSDRRQRSTLLRNMWQSIGKVFVLACVLDIAYSLITLGEIRPVETLIVAFGLAIVPYALVRGVVTRIARRVRTRSRHM
jgi:hypothetical protein